MNANTNKTIISYILILIAGSLWGSMGLFVRTYNERNLSSFYIVAIRASITFVFLFFILLITDRNKLKIKLKDFWCFLGSGILSVVFFNFCYFKAIVITSLSVAAILLYTAPVFVMIMSRIIFKEKITGKKILSIILTFIGCIFVTGIINGGALSVPGIITGLGAGFGYALYSIFSRFALNKGYSSITITFYTFLIAAIGVLPFIDLNTLVVNAFTSEETDTISIGMIIFALIFGIASTILPYILYTKGLDNVEGSTASIIASIEPVVATLIGIILYHEGINLPSIIGIIFVITGIVLSA